MKNLDDKEFEEAWNSSYSLLPEREVEASWNNFRKKIEVPRRRSSLLIPVMGWAAVFVLGLLVSYFFLENHNPFIKVENLAQAEQEVLLPDGSRVLLKRGSTLSYAEEFRDSRDVHLFGTAFFEVARDPRKKFRVITRFTTTTALGTSFLVAEKSELEDTKVSLYTGKVVVMAGDSEEEQVLTPGESLLYKNGQRFLGTFNPNLSFERGNSYVDVDNEELEEVYVFLEEQYGYKFLKDTATRERVTLRINRSDSLPRILKLLSIINKHAYEINHEKKMISINRK